MAHLRFGDCEIHLPRRELRRDGRRQDLPPKAFALLLKLIERRDRVVTKQELLREVWGRDTASPSVLGRTVMLARRAIGDTAEQPRWIQSVHGVGYRFIGLTIDSGAPLHAPPLTADPGRLRVAVLPCENVTGEDALAWAQVGLMALVGRALAGQGPLEVSPPDELQRVTVRDKDERVTAEHAWDSMALLGLAAVVHPRLTRQGAALWLEYRLFRRGGAVLHGSLRGDDVVALADRLVDDLVRALRPGHTASLPARPAEDPFIRQAWARAVELHGQGDHAGARPLLEVVCRHEPHNADAALRHLDCLAWLRSGEAAGQAQRLLSQADAAADERLRARVLATLAMAPDGAPHCKLALALAAPFAEEDWALDLHLHAAHGARTRGDLAAAGRLLSGLDAMRTRKACAPLMARVDVERASYDLAHGELADARERLERSIAFERRLHRRAPLASALALQAFVKLSLGFLDSAIGHVDEVLQFAAEVSLPAEVPGLLLRVCHERQDGDRIRRILALPGARSKALQATADACLALARADLKGTRKGWFESMSIASASNDMTLLFCWLPLWLRIQAACGVEGTAACAEQRAGPFADHPVVQAGVWHAHASHAWRSGRRAEAREALDRMAQVLPTGRELACAQLDLAWCALEAGDLAAAERWLSGLGPWLREHPVGLATHARRLHALGCHAEAAQVQRDALRRFGGHAPPVQLALRDHYARCASNGAPQPRPVPPCLPSDAWLPVPAAEVQAA